MSETVIFRGGPVTGRDGHVTATRVVTVKDCTVYPRGERQLTDVDISGDLTAVTVLAPAGTAVAEGDTAVIRGIDFEVVSVPFDWSVGRYPRLRRHRPRFEIHCERREG